MQNTVYLLLGTNIGNLHQNLNYARKELETANLVIKHRSKIYKTEPWGVVDQPTFLNQVLGVSTTFKPEEILETVLAIEKKAGRERKEKWGPRVLDIDILFYNDEVLITENLTIPHPQLHLRKFTLEPLDEIAPELWHPVLNKTIHQLLLDCRDDSQSAIPDTSASR